MRTPVPNDRDLRDRTRPERHLLAGNHRASNSEVWRSAATVHVPGTRQFEIVDGLVDASCRQVVVHRHRGVGVTQLLPGSAEPERAVTSCAADEVEVENLGEDGGSPVVLLKYPPVGIEDR